MQLCLQTVAYTHLILHGWVHPCHVVWITHVQAVEEFIQQERAASIDAEAPAAPATPEPAPAQNVEDAPSEPQAAPQPPPSRSSAIAMPRASPGVYGNAPLSANSYQQAVATSLRRRGFISATGTSESNDL
jgi:hypothetical protein